MAEISAVRDVADGVLSISVVEVVSKRGPVPSVVGLWAVHIYLVAEIGSSDVADANSV